MVDKKKKMVENWSLMVENCTSSDDFTQALYSGVVTKVRPVPGALERKGKAFAQNDFGQGSNVFARVFCGIVVGSDPRSARLCGWKTGRPLVPGGISRRNYSAYKAQCDKLSADRSVACPTPSPVSPTSRRPTSTPNCGTEIIFFPPLHFHSGSASPSPRKVLWGKKLWSLCGASSSEVVATLANGPLLRQQPSSDQIPKMLGMRLRSNPNTSGGAPT